MPNTKSPTVVDLLERIPLRAPVPEPVDEFDLIQQGMLAVLLRVVKQKQAESAVRALSKTYSDWNEVRVSQAQEIAGVMNVGARGVPAARLVKEYLQEIFQNSHGLELEFLREDAAGAARFVGQLPFMGMATANFILWCANGRSVPITPPLIRVLDRVGIVPRIASVRKARAAIEPLVPKGRDLEFIMRFGEVASNWCDPRKPICWECKLVAVCKHGGKVHKDWKEQQARLAAQRAREEARQAAQEKKEEERRKREEERERKRAQAAAEKRAREEQRKKAADQRRRDQQRARLEREKRKTQAAKKREADKKKKEAERARKAAAAEAKRKKEAARQAAAKKAAAKKAAAKKAAAKKKAASKKSGKRKVTKKPSTAARKATAKKTTARKPAARKSTAKKPTSKKKAARKSSTKGPASKKKTTKKSTTTRKSSTSKTPARKKPASKKKTTTRKKTTTKQPTARKTNRRKR